MAEGGPLTWADVTPRDVFLNRRRLIAGGAAAFGLVCSGIAGAQTLDVAASPYSTDEEPNSLSDITSYNNFYEFGTDKSEPLHFAQAMTTSPWSIAVDGLVDNPGTYPLQELVAGLALEERIYRLRCVEAWSMVVPWAGFELAQVLQRLGVRPEARFVRFETLVRPEEMRGQRWQILPWPYVEGLRIDEAMHPLTILATGLYREPMPKQNGAPIRLVVPWKYGFKSIKSIVRISLVEEQPVNTWQAMAPNEYGFYANVNPEVDHPRWSQATERRVGAGLFARRQPTLPLNGYADQVAHLYEGMDPTQLY